PDSVGPYDRPDRLARLSVLLQRAVLGEIDIAAELRRRPSQQPSRMKVFRVPPRVLVDTRGSATHTIVEVNGRDRPGFLYLVSNALAGCEVQIYTANIATFGETAVDVFYVKDRFGLKILQDERLRQIQSTVTAAIADADGEEDEAGGNGPSRRAAGPGDSRRQRGDAVAVG
ncbi:MAG: hypothetical protein JNK11_13415, partial [Alphaproteobacteria bacterium]|nr:hypothetical protein [Alphaproteobacteria bacterium]